MTSTDTTELHPRAGEVAAALHHAGHTPAQAGVTQILHDDGHTTSWIDITETAEETRIRIDCAHFQLTEEAKGRANQHPSASSPNWGWVHLHCIEGDHLWLRPRDIRAIATQTPKDNDDNAT